MSKSFKHIGIVTSILVIGFIIYNFIFLPTVNADVTNSEPTHKLNPRTLTTIITQDSIMLSPGDVIEFKGFIKDINFLNGRTNMLLHLDEDSNTFVICDMQSNQLQKIESSKKNDTIKVKGIYKGILKDVILLNCVIPD